MSTRQGLWCGLVVGAVAVSVVFLLRLANTPVPRHGLQAVTQTPTKVLAKPASAPDPTVRIVHTPHWQDPSIDPKVLERAFAPPPSDMPPEAIPEVADIQPDPETWERLEAEDQPIAY